MSEFGGLWKHENNQHALVPLKTECGCPSGGGINKGDIRYPHMEERRKKSGEKKEWVHFQLGYNETYTTNNHQ